MLRLIFPSDTMTGGRGDLGATFGDTMDAYHNAVHDFSNQTAPWPRVHDMQNEQCSTCGMTISWLKQRWEEAHQVNGMEPTQFQHRCREQLTSSGGPCDCDIRNFFWERACPQAEMSLEYGRQHGNGISCAYFDYTSQFFEFHRSALPELHRCCGCPLDMRTEVIITVRPEPAECDRPGEYVLKATYALGGTIITRQPWKVLPNSFGALWHQLRLWMKLLHARVLRDGPVPPRIHCSGRMVSLELLQAEA